MKRIPNHNYDILNYRNGSIDMTYTFNVTGTQEVNTATLATHLVDVFNDSGILLDPDTIAIIPGRQTDPEGTKYNDRQWQELMSISLGFLFKPKIQRKYKLTTACVSYISGTKSVGQQ